MKTYLAYIRVSTVKQGEHGSSLHEQKSAIEAYAVRHGLEISGWYEEMVTAAKTGRQQFDRLLKELKKGRAAGVVIHKIDRSARNLKDWAHLGELIDMGVEVHFAHESVDMTSRGGRLAADIQAVVAADYVRNLRDETRKGFYGRLHQGLYPLAAPPGYSDNGKGGKLKTIDPLAGPIVRQGFELYATGNHSLETLRLELHRQGLHAAGGKPLSLNGMSVLLHNPFYIGLMHIKRTGETFQGRHEPLIDAATFNRVQNLLAGRTYARPRKHEFLFRRLLRCASCGYALIGEVHKGHAYYRCHSKSCRGTSIRETALCEDLQVFVDSLTLPAQDIRDFRDFVDVSAADRIVEARHQAEARRRDLDLCNGRLERLTDALLDGSIDKDMFEQRKAKLLVERRALQDQIEHPEEDRTAVALLKKLELGNTAPNIVRSGFAPEIRDLLKEVTSNFEVWRKNVVFTPQFPFSDILKWKHPLPSDLRTGLNRTGAMMYSLDTKSGRRVWLNLKGEVGLKTENSVVDFLKKLFETNNIDA